MITNFRFDTLSAICRSVAVLAAAAFIHGIAAGTAVAEMTITDVTPVDTQTHHDAAAGLSFKVDYSWTVPADNIELTVNGMDRSGALTMTNDGWQWSISYNGLFPNQVYDAQIRVTDSGGVTKSHRVRFDTLKMENLSIEAQHSNFSGGQFLDEPDHANSGYRAGVTVQNVDANWTATGGLREYRSGDFIATYELRDGRYVPSYTRRPHFVNAGIHEYAISNMAAGAWLNYTKTIPEGRYAVFGRMAANWAINIELSRVTGDRTQPNQATEKLGSFTHPTGTGAWQVYHTLPLLDNEGNLAIVELSDVETLRLTFVRATNMNFITLVPVDAAPPIISGLNTRDRSFFNDPQDGIRFTVSSDNGVNVTGITLLLNGQDRTSDLVISGEANLREVLFDQLEMNGIYSVEIAVTDVAGQVTERSSRFDTFHPNHFTFEAQDWNFDGGNFIDNPPLAAAVTPNYRNKVGLQDVDKNVFHHTGRRDYRVDENQGTGAWSHVNPTWPKRPAQIAAGADEYNLGWIATGEWFNYTRTFPAGSYYVYGYMGAAAAMETFLDRVTGDRTQPDQETVRLGTFRHPATGGWQVYEYVALQDDSGEPVVVELNGVETLRFTVGDGTANVNFFMLVSVDGEPPLGAHPELTIARGAAGVILSWETTGYVLEASPDLVGWTQVATVSPFEEEIESLERRFYRLRRE